jgi:hypothetical protein
LWLKTKRRALVIKVTSNVEQVSVRLGKWLLKVGSSGRHLLYSAAANAVAIIVRAHLRHLGSWKHQSAERLGAQPTGILGRAATRTTSNATSEYGEVVIPTPAVRRAFHDVEIRPKSWDFLTIPASREAYGKRAGVLAALGWKIFRPGKKKILMGRLGKDAPKVLYYLSTSVHQRQDRSLLPSDREISSTAANAMMAIIRKAS